MTSTVAGSVTVPVQPLPHNSILLRGRRPGRSAGRSEPASREAQRFAAAILEVLAGMRTPTEAAMAMGTSVARYYLWEQRALAGLVGACEPRACSSRRQIASLQKEIALLKQDCARQHALVRAAQRTIGLAPPPTPKPVPKASGKTTGKGGNRVAGKRARKRRPVVRALKAAAALRAAPAAEETPPSSSGVLSPEVLQRTAGSSPRPPVPPTPVALAASGG
jgi:hypothetical protein